MERESWIRKVVTMGSSKQSWSDEGLSLLKLVISFPNSRSACRPNVAFLLFPLYCVFARYIAQTKFTIAWMLVELSWTHWFKATSLTFALTVFLPGKLGTIIIRYLNHVQRKAREKGWLL